MLQHILFHRATVLSLYTIRSTLPFGKPSLLTAIRDLNAATHTQKENVLPDGPYKPVQTREGLMFLLSEQRGAQMLPLDERLTKCNPMCFPMCLMNLCESNHCKCKFCNNSKVLFYTNYNNLKYEIKCTITVLFYMNQILKCRNTFIFFFLIFL